MIRSASALWRSCRQATAKRTSDRSEPAIAAAARTMSGRLRVTSWVREPGRIATSGPGRRALVSQKGLVQRPIGQLVEIGMTDVNRVGNASRVIPGRLERKAAQDLIDVLAHLLHPPACPRPDLRRHEIEDRNTPRLGPAGNPPVQTRIVDQHHRVGPFFAKVAIGHEDQSNERHQVEQDVQKPHDREVDERVEQARRRLPPSARRRSRRTGRRESKPRSERIRLAACRSPLGSPAEMKIRMGDDSLPCSKSAR